ncbi:hypothetical protein AB0B50_43825 [Streptomyces sp. NPDC041068]|uniref:hypothetical protein n=1 Tax=Streptomyces sp. NPDC041068 TaxID=3155130 RepID=UPI0033D9C0E3
MTPPPNPTNALPPIPTDQLDPPPIWFNVPDGFYALPLAATPEERAERAHEFVRGLYSRGDERIWEPAAPYYAGLADLMADTGISYSAMGLFSTAEEETQAEAEGEQAAGNEGSHGVAQCAFTVAAVPTDQASGDTETVAQGILTVLSSTPHNDARWLDLPCGPAVSCVTLTEYKLNPEITATGEATDLLTGQIQVHVPFPTGPFTAVLTLHTASTDYWTEFCNLMAAVLQTVSFSEPNEDGDETDDAPAAEVPNHP